MPLAFIFITMLLLNNPGQSFAKVMQEISFVEMHHLEIFADMCTHLAVDPRLWDCQMIF